VERDVLVDSLQEDLTHLVALTGTLSGGSACECQRRGAGCDCPHHDARRKSPVARQH
jgi:hypothetical protein